MTTAFDPQSHLIQLPRRVKDAETGKYITHYDAYLEVKWRLLMFRERYPHGVITTEEIAVDLDRGYARYKATVQDGEGGIATGFGTETKADFADFCERAETRALGRALACMGYGTQFVGQDLTEGEHVCDAPVTTTGLSASEPPSHRSTNGQVPPAPPHGKDRPTEADITALTTLAVVTCHDEPDVFAQRIRRTMGLKPSASVALKLLTRTMTMTQFQEVMAYYERLQAQLGRPTVDPEEHGDEPAAKESPVPESAPFLTEEHSRPVPFVESSPAPIHVPAKASTAAAGPGPQAPPTEGYVTLEQLAALKRLAARVGPEAAEDLADVLEHSPKGLLPDLYCRIEARLQSRLNGHTAAAVA